jgi:hypothetical protein
MCGLCGTWAIEDERIMSAKRMGLLAAIGIVAMAMDSGCAHRRETYYPPEPGVRVRAPFVDVRVPTGPKPAVLAPPAGAGYGADQFAPEPQLDLD